MVEDTRRECSELECVSVFVQIKEEINSDATSCRGHASSLKYRFFPLISNADLIRLNVRIQDETLCQCNHIFLSVVQSVE